VFIWRSLLESGRFPELTPYLRARLAESTVRAGRDRLYFNQLSEARLLFRDAFRTSPGWEPCASYLMSVLPRAVRRAAGLSQS
jgi:hypothetical protein